MFIVVRMLARRNNSCGTLISVPALGSMVE
jgi:hypothetical protein